MKQYEEHWENPSQTKIMWIGLLFSMLSLMMLSFYLNDDEPPEYEGTSHSLYELYRLRTAQCLMMGDIVRILSDSSPLIERLMSLSQLNLFSSDRERSKEGCFVY
jgi:hypothetical protein